MKAPRTDMKKLIQRYKTQTTEYYNGWVEAEKVAERKSKLYNHSIDLLAILVKEKQELESRPPEIKEIIKEIPVEIIKEIPVEVVKEIIVEIPKEVIKEIEIIKEIEVIKEVKVPFEVVKVKVVKEIYTKQYKRLVTYAYLLTMYALPQILWVLIS